MKHSFTLGIAWLSGLAYVAAETSPWLKYAGLVAAILASLYTVLSKHFEVIRSKQEICRLCQQGIRPVSCPRGTQPDICPLLPHKPRVLMIDDDTNDQLLLGHQLKPWVDVENADTLQEGLTRLQNERFDIALLDPGLPDTQGIDTLTVFRSRHPNMPAIVVTGSSDPRIAKVAMDLGYAGTIIKTTQMQARKIAQLITSAITPQKTV